MTGKSSALILRQMHPNMVKEAEKYDLFVDFPSWFSSLSLEDGSVGYMTQKTMESEYLIKQSEQDKKEQKLANILPNLVESGDEVRNVMNDILAAIELSNEKRKRAPNSSKRGGY